MMTLEKTEDILPENSSDFTVTYEVQNPGLEGIVWIVKVRCGYGRVYHSSLSITSERIESVGLEGLILEMQNAITKTISEAVEEELLKAHVGGEQKITGGMEIDSDSNIIGEFKRHDK